jgi:hypothetical protein
MKKSLFGIAAVALLFVLAGCPQPTESLKQEPAALPGPGNLQANVNYDGIVILTWNPVPNASGYAVIRRDTVGPNSQQNLEYGVNVALTPTPLPPSQFYYIDTVDFNNLLVHQRSYEYSVVSISRSSSAVTEGSGSITVQNGVSKVTAKPRIPGPNEFAPTLSGSDITVTRFDASGADKVRVEFPNKPNYAYTVTYTYGTGSIVQEIGYVKTTGALLTNLWYSPKNFVEFPTLGGDNTITVKAKFPNSYYTGTTEATATTNFALAVGLATPGTPTATRYNGYVLLTWTNNRYTATSHKVYRAEISSGNIADNGTITGNWTAVPGTPEYVIGNGSWELKDTLSTDAGYYLYVVVAEAGSAKSLPNYGVASPYGLPPLTSVTPNTSTPGAITLTWTYNPPNIEWVVEGYPVRNAIATNLTPSTTNYVLDGDAIPDGTITVLPSGVTYVSPTLASGYYIFKITGTRNGVSVTYHIVVQRT